LTATPAPRAAPKVTGVLETCLYVDDLQKSCRFYEALFGFRRMELEAGFCAYDVARHSVLILFLRGATRKPVHLSGGVIPPHDGNGPMHLAFSIAAGDVAAWEERLQGAGIALESRVHWQGGAQSLYFRDPDYHLLELATPGLWPNDPREEHEAKS
jgi:catechol 2,3-dioxygenase-like lactoylglutathione lyase family enzyme